MIDQMCRDDVTLLACDLLSGDILCATLLMDNIFNYNYLHYLEYVGHGGALVESIAFNRRVVGSTPALAAM